MLQGLQREVLGRQPGICLTDLGGREKRTSKGFSRIYQPPKANSKLAPKNRPFDAPSSSNHGYISFREMFKPKEKNKNQATPLMFQSLLQFSSGFWVTKHRAS